MATLAQAETALVGPAPNAGAGQVGRLLLQAGFDATGTSPVAALAPAITGALVACGVTPDDPTAPSDNDMGKLASADWPKFLDIAGLLLMEVAVFSFTTRAQAEQWEDYRVQRYGTTDLAALLEARRKQVARLWGYGGAVLRAGLLRIRPKDTTPEF